MGILLVLYLFDFSYWGGCIGIWARRLFVSISMACMVAGAIVSAERFTYMPAAVYVLGGSDGDGDARGARGRGRGLGL